MKPRHLVALIVFVITSTSCATTRYDDDDAYQRTHYRRAYYAPVYYGHGHHYCR